MSGPNNNAINEKLNWLIKILKGLNKKINNCNSSEQPSEPSEPSEGLTAFNVSSEPGDICVFPLGLPYTTVLYHDGNNALPVNGNAIYTDANGTIPYNSECSNVYEITNGLAVLTDNGVYDDTILCVCR